MQYSILMYVHHYTRLEFPHFSHVTPAATHATYALTDMMYGCWGVVACADSNHTSLRGSAHMGNERNDKLDLDPRRTNKAFGDRRIEAPGCQRIHAWVCAGQSNSGRASVSRTNGAKTARHLNISTAHANESGSTPDVTRIVLT